MGDCKNAPVSMNGNAVADHNKNGDAVAVVKNGKNGGEFSEPKEEAKDDESNVQLNARWVSVGWRVSERKQTKQKNQKETLHTHPQKKKPSRSLRCAV